MMIKCYLIKLPVALTLMLLAACQTPKVNNALDNIPVWQSGRYTLYRDRVVQQKYTARALSPTEITSNYQSPANNFKSPQITFKFSINGKDNEMESGRDHHFTCLAQGGACETPLITFGQQLNDARPVPDNTFLAPNTPLKIRVDMRQVLAAFNQQGYYTTYRGDKIYKEDFRGVYVAGSPAPLSWDFDNLVNNPGLALKDPDGDGIYEVNLILNVHQAAKAVASRWKQSKNTAAFPQYTSGYPLTDALYNLALEEMVNAVEPDSTFRTGKEWSGVWTRDISYSIILAMATLQPRVSQNSLLRKVKNGRIIQDTGTGGAYPVSTDRMIWAVAAWELYKVTGDQEWLKKAYAIVKKSVDDDLQNIYDAETGLARGESSFLDWREQTYPKWMQPADIFESECLGTNAVHYQANIVLAQMAEQLNEPARAVKYRRVAEGIKQGLNTHLWLLEKGYYGQYLYGRHSKILSPRAEALGEALAVLFDIADPAQQKSVVANTPVMDFGIPCIYPQIPNIPPYHNNAVWPFVQAYWSLAAAKAGNERALTESMAAIYRPAALFLTNKENFVASNSDYAGTQINSSNMLWSLAGTISLTYKVLFGMDFQSNRLVFKPFVPQAFAGKRTLTNFRYRQAMLDIELEGYGNIIQTITLDGEPLTNAAVPAGLAGKHTVRIRLANNILPVGTFNKVPEQVSPAAPAVTYAAPNLRWPAVAGAGTYKVLRNGKVIATSATTQARVPDSGYGEYQVIALNPAGYESFASEPVLVLPEKNEIQIEMETLARKAPMPYKGFSGNGFVEIGKRINTHLPVGVTVPEAGLYAIDFRYANGNGPTNTDNKCAIRTLKKNNTVLGTFVFPQRGTEEWSNWGYSNPVLVELEKGKTDLLLTLMDANENMHGEINQAMLDYVRLIKVK